MENPILTVFDETGSKKMKLESEIDETGINPLAVATESYSQCRIS